MADGTKISHMRRLCLFYALTVMVLLSGCSFQSRIAIGFSGQLTGNYSDLGVQGRNGAQLAIEEINSQGGLANKQLYLISADDRNNPEAALKADNELLDAGAAVIIGHMTSAVTVAVSDQVNARGGVMISPTTSTSMLTGIQDGFFRTMPDLTMPALGAARYLNQNGENLPVSIIWDQDNEAYAALISKIFSDEFVRLGGTVASEQSFSSSRDEVDWVDFIGNLETSGTRILFCAVSAMDLTKIAQARHLLDADIFLFSAPWAYTSDILSLGGTELNGIEFAAFYADDNPYIPFQNFKKRFRERFGRDPSFAAAFAYEAVQAFAAAVEANNGRVTGFENYLPGLAVSGVMGNFSFDSFGDVQRHVYIVTIDNNSFRTIEMVK